MTMFGRGRPVGARPPWVVWVLVAIGSLPFLLSWLSPDAIQHFLLNTFALDIKKLGAQPWTVLTYPLSEFGLGRNVISVIFQCYWLYMVGTALERDLGPGWLMSVFGIGTILHGMAAIAASGLHPFGAFIVGAGLPTAFLTLIWCGRNQGMLIKLFGVIPLSGKLLAVLVAVATLFLYGSATSGPESKFAPLFGLVVTLPLALAWFYGTDILPLRYGRLKKAPTSNKKTQKEFDEFITKVRDREKERDERERLRKLFEDSLDDKK